MSDLIQTVTSQAHFHPGPAWSVRVATVFARAVHLFLLWSERARQRRELANLTPRLLDDMGVSRDEALREAAKPFWRA